MAYVHAVAAVDLQWTLYAASLLVGVLPDALLLILRRGFGRGGFGRGLGGFRLFRVLFVLLFTTIVGPIVLVALIAFFAYRFFVSRRGR
jgi:hypothetical protein